MRPIDAALLQALVVEGDKDLIEALAPDLADQLPEGGIDRPLRVAHFLAQACVETWRFTRLQEDLDYGARAIAITFPRLASRAAKLAHQPEALANAAYANRNGNGNEATGDGWQFRGRGLLSLTGRANYRRIGDVLAKKPIHADAPHAGIVDDPDRVGRPTMAVATAVAFWNLRRCNVAADADDCMSVTRAINGGVNGFTDRFVLKQRALRLLQ